MPLSGSLADESCALLLPKLFLEKANGVLTLSHEDLQKKIFFMDGLPVGAISNLRTETLGHYLLQRNKISQDDLERVIQYMIEKRSIQGRALIELGYLQENELFQTLLMQTFEKVVQAFTWREGQFVFEEGLDLFAHETCFPLNIQDLYAKGMLLSLGEEGVKKQVREILKEDPRTREVKEWLLILSAKAFGISRPREDELTQKSNKQKEWEELIVSAYLDSCKKNHFELLGVSPESSQSEIKQAYYALAKKFHPDRFRGKIRSEVMRILENLFGQINEASQILTHAPSRQLYLTETLPRMKAASDHQNKRHEQVIHAEALCLKGESAQRSGNYPEAMALFQEAHERDPNQPHYDLLLTWMQYQSASEKKEGLREICKLKCAAVLRVDSHWAKAHYFLGVLLLEEGQINAGIHALQEALRFAPADPEILQALRASLEKSRASAV